MRTGTRTGMWMGVGRAILMNCLDGEIPRDMPRPPKAKTIGAISTNTCYHRPPVIRRRCWRDEDWRDFEVLDAELIIREERHAAYLLGHLQRHHGRMPEPQGDYDVFVTNTRIKCFNNRQAARFCAGKSYQIDMSFKRIAGDIHEVAFATISAWSVSPC
jgi:hypothetical protein